MRPSNILENKNLLYESSGSHLFRTTTAIQSGQGALEQSKFVMTFPTNLEVTEILCSFLLVLEGKAGKEISELSRIEFNSFVQSEAECNTSGPLNKESIADLPLLTTFLAICQKPRSKFLGSNRCFCFISISQFDSFKNPFAKITFLSEFPFRYRRFVLLV